MSKQSFFDLVDREMKSFEAYYLRDMYRWYGFEQLPKAHVLPDKIQDALNALALACADQGMKLNSVDIKKTPIKPYTTEYVVHTAGGNVKVTREM